MPEIVDDGAIYNSTVASAGNKKAMVDANKKQARKIAKILRNSQ